MMRALSMVSFMAVIATAPLAHAGPAAAEPAEPAAEPAAAPEVQTPTEPAVAPEPDTPELDTPEPAVAATTTVAPVGPVATDDEKAPSRFEDDEDGPVQRAEKGDWGMTFRFGGLAPMSIAGVNSSPYPVNRLLFSEVGFRKMITDKLVFPFSVGLGIFHHNPEGGGGTQNDFGLAVSLGIIRNFKVWRRIVPHAGARLHVHYLDPTGDNNWLVNASIGPLVGVEYFIGDRVSLLLQAMAAVGINAFDGLTQAEFATQIAAGGQMGLTFYF